MNLSVAKRLLERRFAASVCKTLTRKQSKISYTHGSSDVPMRFETMGQSLRNIAEKHPDREFCVFRKFPIRKTFSQFYSDARKMAASLYSLGVQRGDRVGMWGHNYYEWVVMQYACAMSGVIQVNVNPHYVSEELKYVLKKCGIKVLVSPKQHKKANYLQALVEIIPEMRRGKPGVGIVSSHELPELRHIVTYGDDEPVVGAWNWNELLEAGGTKERKQLELMDKLIRPDDPVNMQFTSGTTGNPKGATLTHHGIINTAYFCGIRAGFADAVEKICVPNPLYHCFGCVLAVANAVSHGQTLIFPSISYNVKHIFAALQQEKCTFMYGTPTMFIDLLTSPHFKTHDISSLKGAFMSGAPCPYALCEKLVNKLNMNNIVLLYGSTELSPLATMSLPETPTFERIKSVGHAMPHVELQIVDENGNVVPRGTRGELWSRGFNTMLYYWGDKEKTEKEIGTDRWYHTGDTASMNEDGTINIVGRSRDMIVKGGENIYPTEIEQFMYKLPYIADACVVGVPDERYGENVCAWIRLKDAYVGKVDAEKLINDCKGKIAHYKVPKYVLIKEQKDFPMTVSGKVKKFEMQRLSKIELGLASVRSHFNN